ncbi:HNH endonuclease signature motif containing protein [Cryobacterium sp. Y62]|uniref:HNH endonuclease signature motif containing protein n=1 Tax=Cryobacterium sp. Y62 TaxID=2048284 RepID=UPI001304F42C|nr:HNH endonuclease signature motif containing protein [Cryobacterium sp. Y62]
MLPVTPASLVVPPVVVVPWQAPIMHAVAEGTFSPGVGDALLRGLGTLDQAITAEKLAAALLVLLVEAPGMNTEQAYKRARRLRDDLDAAGILAREKQARDDTTWSLWRRADGMVTLHALMAPEQGELWMATYDALTSPRRGGVRFVDPERAAWAQSVKDDPRTVAQIAADSFTQLLKLGADADPNTLFGGRRPVVQVIVTEHDRPTSIPAPSTFPAPSGRTATADAPVMTPAATTSNSPFGYIEGNPAPVSAETIERHLCDTGYLGILFSQTGQPLNVGRDERLFNREQRRALAARDGGCRWPGCDQSPSWSESHHVENWADLGLSNIDHAILLCAHHHMLLHNQHWKILLQSGLYWLQPPVEIDPKQALIALPSKNPLMQPPLALNQPTSTTAVAGTADHGASRDGGLGWLDQRRGDDPRAGHQHDDYRH